MALLFFPSIRALFHKKPKTDASQARSKKRFILVAGDIALGVTGATLVQYAVALGSVSMVNALAGAQYAILIFLVALISKFFPNILKETFTSKEIVQKIVAVVIISIGLILLLIK